MDRRQWRERLEAELARRGVPARFRRRLLEELRDHFDDLTEEGTDMTEDAQAARLGRPEDVAAAAADQYRRATWVARHPLVVFGLLPVPALVAGFAGSLLLAELVIGAALWAAGADLSDPPRGATVPVAYGLC